MKLFESPETQNAFEKITYSVISELARKMAKLHPHDPNNPGVEDLAATVLGTLYPAGKGSLKFPKTIQDFIKQTQWLRFAFVEKTGTTSGFYSSGQIQPEIFIGITEDEIRAIVNAPYAKAESILNSKRSTIIHELVHAYDDWISKGKFRENKRSEQSDDDRRWNNDWNKNPEKFARYLNNPVEINARFSEVVSRFKAKLSYTPWKEILWQFKQDFGGWKIISDDEKRRLINRLAQEWLNVRGPNRRSLDTEVKEFSSKIKEEYSSDIYVNTNGRNLEINGLDTNSSEIINAVIAKAIKFADIRKMEIGLEYIPISPELRQLGFVPNKGSRKHYDHPIGTTVYRPAREDKPIKTR